MKAPNRSGRPESPYCVYASLASGRIGSVPESMRRLLLADNDVHLVGELDVLHGRRWLSRAVTGLMCLPRVGRHQRVRLSVIRRRGYELWQRQFEDRAISTVQYLSDSLLAERVGPIELLFEVDVNGGALLFTSTSAKLRLFNFGIRLPNLIAPVVCARMTSRSPDEIHTAVRIATRLTGEILMYSGTMREVSE